MGRLPARLRQRAGFVLSFFLENRIYVDIMSVFKEKNKDDRANPQGECPVDIQANEPQSGWDAQRQPKLSSYFFPFLIQLFRDSLFKMRILCTE